MSLLLLFTEPRRYTLSVTAASYVWTGNNVGLYYGHLLTVVAAAYTWLTNAVTLTYDTANDGSALIGMRQRRFSKFRMGARIGSRK